ncbi:hypothetical protein PanWU01x14_250930 [Parasponia andersonii]|uniref:Uncharacterized protein n=1 Tax=Parasponia andersonii TaxID=3476 RepID=A0A2P5BCS0_PARAD|nr:hypothetical protein PanWU01x14_250930 [Parasponia andersonii]
MNPRAALVAADLDVVLGREQRQQTVVQGGKGRNALVVLLVVVNVVDFPNSDLVVLVGSKELIPGKHQRLDGAYGDRDRVFRWKRIAAVVELIRVSGPEANLAVGEGAVEELPGEDEGGDVGGVGW